MSVIIVLSDCPPKLRGDMTKWFFEINTGVYVGNMSARVRENLWQRITENIGRGHATMVYSAHGEQRMDFRVHNAYWKPMDFDGIKLMLRPERLSVGEQTEKTGFSNASKYRKAGASTKKLNELAQFFTPSYVVLDFETTGLDENKDEIIEIGAILVDRGKVAEKMQLLVQINGVLSEEITQFTGITSKELARSGIPLADAIQQLLDLAEDLPFVCHNASFEDHFLQNACLKTGNEAENRFIDTLEMAQLLLPDMKSHKLFF